MSFQYEESVIDFDLDFLHQTSNEVSPEKCKDKNEKNYLAVNIAKKKIVATDSLIRKFYDKKEELDQVEKTLYSSREECKKVCIDLQTAMEENKKLKTEAQALRNINQQLQDKWTTAQNSVDAQQSYTHQLQILVKKYETELEGFKVESQLEKCNLAKDYEKKLSTLQKENDILSKNMNKDVILGKKNLNKLHKIQNKKQKYNKSDESDDNDSVLGGVNSDDDNCNFDDISDETYKEGINSMSTKIPEKHYAAQIESVVAKSDNELDSDTGRGSSLAFSDSDKCFHSPDYVMENSPIDTNVADKITRHLVDVGTSPISSHAFVDIATSPMIKEPPLNTAKCSKSVSAIYGTVSGMSPLAPRLFDEGRNKVAYESDFDREITKTPTMHHELCQKECLEMNNSNYYEEHDSGDGEIESILSKMRLTHSLITPIPTTPKSQKSSCPSVTKNYDLLSFVCKDALKVSQENVKLKASIAQLASEIKSIKDMLKRNDSLHQHYPKTAMMIDSEFCEDLISIPEDVLEEQLNAAESVFECAEMSNLEFTNQCIPEVENQPTETVLHNDSEFRKGIKRLEFEEPLLNLQNNLSCKTIQEFEDEDICETSNIDKTIDSTNRRPYKLRKLTKLERLRRKFIPKSKIKAKPLIRKTKNKKVSLSKINNKAAAVEINNKNAYEKAVKIMSELKSQPKVGKANKIASLEKLEKHSFNETNILDSILGLQLSSKTPIVVLSRPKDTSPKDTQDSLHDKQNVGKQDPKKIIILEDILLTKPKNVFKKDQPQQIPVLTELSDFQNSMISSEATKDTECVQEDKIQLPNCTEVLKYYKETETKQGADDKITHKKQNDSHKETTQNVETHGGEINKHSSITVNEEQNYKSEEMNIAIPSVKAKSPQKNIKTRSRKKVVEDIHMVKETQIAEHVHEIKGINESNYKLTSESSIPIDIELDNNNKESKEGLQQTKRKRKAKTSIDTPEVECKRTLRSSTRLSSTNENTKVLSNNTENVKHSNDIMTSDAINTEKITEVTLSPEKHSKVKENIISYDDIDIFSESNQTLPVEENKTSQIHPKDSILRAMIDKYGKQSTKNFSNKVRDTIVNKISKTIANEIETIIDSPTKDSNRYMDKFVETIEKWEYRHFMAGLMQYLKDPQRKIELFNKVSVPSAPHMTKSEQILLYVISRLKQIWTSIDVVDSMLCNIEYTLFKLNRTPEFDTIESMSHFYAITCRYFKMKSRLRVFMLDAMYCIQFKAVPLIKQCMEVWMHVLPLAHMGIAKNPLVTCMVYLLHFYKCDDKFNRVQDIRYLLNRKYFYEITDWNEPKIIEMFKNAIQNVRAIPVEMKLLRIALIVLAKRHGPKWCQKHIIKSLLIPMIESETYSERVKVFCVSILGALLKPYPVDMRVHYEIVMNMLLDMLDQNPSPKMEEAIFTSLIYMSRHSYDRIVQALLTWKPQQISPEFENLLRDFVSEKSLKMWKGILCKNIVNI